MNTIQQVNQAIMFGDWTDIELNSMIDAVKWKRASIAKFVKNSVRLGDSVEFTSSRTGMAVQGTVKKIAIKYVTVATSQGLWKVPANMLRVLEVA